MKYSYEEFRHKAKYFLKDYVPFYKGHCFVAGGIFPRLYHDLPVRDIDIYCDDSYLSDLLGELERAKFKRIMSSRDGKFHRFNTPKTDYQIDVINFHKPQDIRYIKDYDFTICQCAMDSAIFQVYDSKSIDQKILKLNSCCDLTTHLVSNNILIRMKKYQELGFTISNGELTRICSGLLLTKPGDAIKNSKKTSYPE